MVLEFLNRHDGCSFSAGVQGKLLIRQPWTFRTRAKAPCPIDPGLDAEEENSSSASGQHRVVRLVSCSNPKGSLGWNLVPLTVFATFRKEAAEIILTLLVAGKTKDKCNINTLSRRPNGGQITSSEGPGPI